MVDVDALAVEINITTSTAGKSLIMLCFPQRINSLTSSHLGEQSAIQSV